ncbi:nuclease-related domain-containing protein [Sinomonas atrocyanea]|uniref:nuclease-related domain-containing protein n=1 Tax=Sinomonas atrocyanea TaxID=37927 RepID=UPI003D964A8D
MQWAWYRNFGGGPNYVTPELRKANRAVVWRALLRVGGCLSAAVGALAALSLLAFVTGTSKSPGWAPLVLGALLVGFVWFVRILAAAARQREHNRGVAAAAAREGRAHGSPGGIRTAGSRFGAAQVQAGAVGEEATALLLDMLLSIPGTAVFHGLQFPYDGNADVDHAVARGNVVFLIDSKLYRWGTYQWDARRDRDVLVRTDGYGSPRPNAMHVAAEGYRRLLGRQVEVIPLVLIHGRGVAVGPSSISAHGVHLATAAQAMERIGNTLAATIGYWPDNPAVHAALVGKLKPPVPPVPPATGNAAPGGG